MTKITITTDDGEIIDVIKEVENFNLSKLPAVLVITDTIRDAIEWDKNRNKKIDVDGKIKHLQMLVDRLEHAKVTSALLVHARNQTLFLAGTLIQRFQKRGMWKNRKAPTLSISRLNDMIGSVEHILTKIAKTTMERNK